MISSVHWSPFIYLGISPLSKCSHTGQYCIYVTNAPVHRQWNAQLTFCLWFRQNWLLLSILALRLSTQGSLDGAQSFLFPFVVNLGNQSHHSVTADFRVRTPASPVNDTLTCMFCSWSCTLEEVHWKWSILTPQPHLLYGEADWKLWGGGGWKLSMDAFRINSQLDRKRHLLGTI